MTHLETLVVMAMLGLPRYAAETWIPGSDLDVTICAQVPAPIGRAIVLDTSQPVNVREAPGTNSKVLGVWRPGVYELWGLLKSRNTQSWALLRGNELEGWCAGQYVKMD